jgi:hypothetical protein
MLLTAQGLQPSTWYLLTYQDPTGTHQFAASGAHCLFGVKEGAGGFEWCDVAFVKTDANGAVSQLVPTDAGLSGGNCAHNRRRHPNADAREQALRVASRWIEPDLMVRAFGWDVARSGTDAL